MLIEDLYSDFLDSCSNRDLKGAGCAVMGTMGAVLAFDRDNFIDLLRESDIDADFDNMSDSRLINVYVESLSDPDNKSLKAGTALLMSYHNQRMGVDGEPGIDNSSAHAIYYTLCKFYESPSANYYSNASGIGQAIGEAAKFGNTIAQGQQKKKYGATDLALKKLDAKNAMTQQVLAIRQAEAENKKAIVASRAKVTKTILIVGGALVGAALITFAIYKIKNRNK